MATEEWGDGVMMKIVRVRANTVSLGCKKEGKMREMSCVR